MSTIWAQTRDGRAFDLIDPDPATIDFHEIAHTLADINRYAGHAIFPISVAWHTLLGADICPTEALPWWLLHDAHEFVLGDIPTPAAHAIARHACEVDGIRGAQTVERAIARAKATLDAAIWRAAGLEPPTPAIAAIVKVVDLRALATERRDGLARPPRPWAPAVEAAQPAPRVYRRGSFGRTPFDVAEALWSRFLDRLPVFHGRAGATRVAPAKSERAPA